MVVVFEIVHAGEHEGQLGVRGTHISTGLAAEVLCSLRFRPCARCASSGSLSLRVCCVRGNAGVSVRKVAFAARTEERCSGDFSGTVAFGVAIAAKWRKLLHLDIHQSFST